MGKIFAVLLAGAMLLSVCACGQKTETVKEIQHVVREDWADDVKQAVNDFVDNYGIKSDNYSNSTYVVFDFDNTCSIFDVQEQAAVYQLQTMSFAFAPEKLPYILQSEIGDLDTDRTDAGYGKGSYQDWIDDITEAYKVLYENYGPFTAEGLSEEEQAKVQTDPNWLEFATKMRAMYDLVFDCESADVAYSWILYWYTGMTEYEVYNLAYASHLKYKEVETSLVTWTSPESIESKTGVVEYTWTSGTQVSDNIRELMSVLNANGIDVWICSASMTDVIRAAIDVWNLHDCVTGMLAMTLCKDEDGKYIPEYDFDEGCGWLANEDGTWVRDTLATKTQTLGIGKVYAINNTLEKKYGCGPMAGFMDSTGDFNFCTEYDTLKLVICFNRATRKVTDGGGVIAELAIYERDTLGYDLMTANRAGDTFYVLQGRDENGLRTFRNSNSTLRYGNDKEQLFKNEENEAQLRYMIENKMSVEDVINTFAIKTDKDAEGNVLGFKYGFLDEYSGYHNRD